VRYNPGGDKALNRRQAERLKQLSDYLHGKGRLFMFELIVPPTAAQLKGVGNNRTAYDLLLRPTLMAQAIRELQGAGVEADVWKVEGLDRKEDCEKIVATARDGGRARVGCIILGRGEDDQKVRQWLATAASVPGFVGFAVGRTTFWAPLVDYRASKITRAAAVERIAAAYREWVGLFEKAK
jgi:5-dehydro-2-deoxygluconokinase